MKFLLLLLLVVIALLLVKLLKSFSISTAITILCTLLIFQIVLDPKLCIESALLGLNLFIKKVFPSLFPFLVITSLMMGYDGVQIYSRFLGKFLCKPLRLPIQCTFAVVVSMLCGYPLGAKYACELYEQKSIDNKTCQRLINIATNTSPLFAIGSVGTSMLSSSYIGYLLLLVNCMSCLVMGVILPSHKITYARTSGKSITSQDKNIGSIIKNSIEGSIKTCLSIGGFVIIYSVIISIIKSNTIFDIAVKKLGYITGVESRLIEGTLLGFIEMTNGCYLISTTSADMYIKFVIISFFLAFSGFSIISQVHSFTYKYDLSMKTYIIRKFVQGLIGAAIASIIFKVQLKSISIEAFNNIIYNHNINILFIVTIALLIIPYLLNRIKMLLFHTP